MQLSARLESKMLMGRLPLLSITDPVKYTESLSLYTEAASILAPWQFEKKKRTLKQEAPNKNEPADEIAKLAGTFSGSERDTIRKMMNTLEARKKEKGNG